VEPYTEAGTEPFFIFPVNGFKFMYSPLVFHSSSQYRDAFEEIISAMGPEGAIETFSEVLKYDYVSADISKGLQQGCEIIVYGIPYFYAVRKDSVISYSTLFSL